MRWQDENPITELIVEGARLDGAYLTVARVGEDRKEAQIGSQPTNDPVGARAWLDRTAADALGTASDVRLRVRLRRADGTAVRGVQTRVWPGAEEALASDDRVAEVGAEDQDEFSHDIDDQPVRDTTMVVRRPAIPTARHVPASPISTAPLPSVRSQAHMRAQPSYDARCPACAAATTTTALLQSRIAELSALLGTEQTAVHDARRDTEEAAKVAQSRGRRAKEAEAEVARLRTENAELVAIAKRLRCENRDLNEGAARVIAALNSFDE